MNSVERIAGNIRRLREMNNYTQEYMASRLAMARETYGKIERGDPALKVDTLYKIAGIFNVTVNSLIDFNTQTVFAPADGNQQNFSVEEAIRSLTAAISSLREQHKLLIQMITAKKAEC